MYFTIVRFPCKLISLVYEYTHVKINVDLMWHANSQSRVVKYIPQRMHLAASFRHDMPLFCAFPFGRYCTHTAYSVLIYYMLLFTRNCPRVI